MDILNSIGTPWKPTQRNIISLQKLPEEEIQRMMMELSKNDGIDINPSSSNHWNNFLIRKEISQPLSAPWTPQQKGCETKYTLWNVTWTMNKNPTKFQDLFPKNKLIFPATPLKINMEPKNHPIEEEHYLPNLHFLGFHVNFRGCNINHFLVNGKGIAMFFSPRKRR